MQHRYTLKDAMLRLFTEQCSLYNDRTPHVAHRFSNVVTERLIHWFEHVRAYRVLIFHCTLSYYY